MMVSAAAIGSFSILTRLRLARALHIRNVCQLATAMRES